MPERIAREVAVARAQRALGGAACLSCALLEGQLGPPLWLVRGTHASVLLPRMALRWGHAMVVLHEHVTRLTQVSDDAWSEAHRLALATARIIETRLSPERVYVASLGTSRDDVPMSSPHLHLHVVPIYDRDDKPASVLTWSHGVYVASEAEWATLRSRLGE